MAIAASAMITLRTNLAEDLEAGIENYLDAVAGGYSEYLAPVVEEGETPLDARYQLVLLGRSVAQQRENIASLDDGVVDQSGEEVKVSVEIKKHTTALGTKMGLVRDTCRGVFGPQSLERVGLKGNLPRSPVRLYSRARVVRRSLNNPELDIEPVLDLAAGEEAVTPAQLATQLEPELGNLRRFVGVRHHGRRKSADVRSRRRQVIEDFDRNVRAIVRMAQGMFRLAGRDDLARRFRPSLKRILRKLDEAPSEEGSTPEEAAGQTGTAEPAANTEKKEATAKETTA